MSFEEWWAAYPRKVAKAEARKAWDKLKPSADMEAAMHEALSWQREQDGWVKDHGAFIPHPATWLRGERWEDEPPAHLRPRQPVGDWRFECRQMHGGRCTNSHFHEAMKEKAS